MTPTDGNHRRITLLLSAALVLTALAAPAAAQDSPGVLAPGNPLHRADLALEQANEFIVGTVYGPEARAHRGLTHAEERIAEMDQLAPRDPHAAAEAASLYLDTVERTQRFMEQNRLRDPALNERTNATLLRAQERLRQHLTSDQIPEQARPGLRTALSRVNRTAEERGLRRGPPAERPGGPATTPRGPRGPSPTPSENQTPGTPPGNRTPGTPENGTPGNTADGPAATPPANATGPKNATGTPTNSSGNRTTVDDQPGDATAP